VRSPEIWFDVPSSRMTMFLAMARPSTIKRIREKRLFSNQRGRLKGSRMWRGREKSVFMFMYD
jgi:hypothetical protein